MWRRPRRPRQTFASFKARAAELGVTLDGVWVQHMFQGRLEMLVTAFRDREFGVMVGCGMGGGMTEIIDDVVFARAPIDADGAEDLLRRLRTLRRMPTLLSDQQARQVAAFIAGFSALVASAPWPTFTLEVNPLKVGANGGGCGGRTADRRGVTLRDPWRRAGETNRAFQLRATDRFVDQQQERDGTEQCHAGADQQRQQEGAG